MITSVQLYDYVRNSHSNLFIGPEQSEMANRFWHTKDTLLVGLSKTTFFKDLYTWSDLKPIHYKYLILQNMNAFPSEEVDDESQVYKSLIFLLSAFVKCLEDASDSSVRILTISRVSSTVITYEFTASLCMNLAENMTPSGFKVVIDNTNDSNIIRH